MTVTRPVSDADVALFALITGDQHPAHLDADFAAAGVWGRRVVPVSFIAGMVEAACAALLGDDSGLVRRQTLSYHAPAFVDDEITLDLIVRQTPTGPARCAITVTREDGVVVATGDSEVSPSLIDAP